MKYISILSKHADAFLESLQASEVFAEFDYSLTYCGADPEAVKHSRTQLFLADPDLAADVIPHLAHLQWFQSTWAGNSNVLHSERDDYLFTGVKGVFSQQMTEYVLTYLLHFCRSVDEFNALQKQATWQPPAITPLAGKTLGILGFGNIANGMVDALHALGLNLVALNRDGRPIFGYPDIPVEAAADKTIFAQQLDFLLNLMPDTPDTAHFIDREFIEALPGNVIFINAGRGSVMADDVLLDALRNKKIHHAILDVFQHEPLVSEHPFWSHPQITITQHTAAESNPDLIFDIFEQNMQRFMLKAPLKYQFNWEKGY